MMQKRLRIKVEDLNPHLVCKLCNGYLVNPVTITECIHTFCRSCILRHISMVNRCPACNEVIHETQPIYSIRADHTMQDIMNKIFPKLDKEESRKERRFYKSRGLPYRQPAPLSAQPAIIYSKESSKQIKKPEQLPSVPSPVKQYHHSAEQISLHLQCHRDDELQDEESAKELDKKFIRCSTHVTIGLLQRFLATKLKLDSPCSVEITHDNNEMKTDVTLKYISDNLVAESERGPITPQDIQSWNFCVQYKKTTRRTSTPNAINTRLCRY